MHSAAYRPLWERVEGSNERDAVLFPQLFAEGRTILFRQPGSMPGSDPLITLTVAYFLVRIVRSNLPIARNLSPFNQADL